MEIKDYKTGDEKEILELFTKVFKSSMSHDYWKWRFHDNPAGKHMIKLMWDKSQLVGHYAVSPVNLVVNGEKLLSTLSMTTMTDPEYGGQGIFGKLASSLYDHISKNDGVSGIWGFPNSNSHYGFITKLDWENIGVVHELFLQSERIKKWSNFDLEESFSFTSEHVNLINKSHTDFSVYVEKSIEYLKWRYIENPSNDYRIFDLKINGRLEGFVVAKQYQDKKGQSIINVLEIHCNPQIESIASLLNNIKPFFETEISNVTLWLSLWDEKYPLLEKAGFQPSGSVAYLGYRSFNKKFNAVSKLSNWWYSFGDSDVY